MFKEISNKIYFIIIIILIIIILFLAFLRKPKSCICDNNDLSLNTQEVEKPVEQVSPINKIKVDLKGEVQNPGVYELNEGSIINDVISLGGGFTKKAYKDNLNLSKKLSDEMVIYVYGKSEFQSLSVKATTSVCQSSTTNISSCLKEGKSTITTNNNSSEDTTTSSKENATTNKMVNINTATAEEFNTLPGIGASKANNIINYRNEHGNFTDITQIKNVTGIGDSIYEQIKNYLTI